MRYTKELVIGITAVATIICFVWGYNFLKGKNIFTMKRDYYAFYEHVHGLQVGQPVTINGFKIGQVTEINFSQSSYGPLLVGFHISKPIDFSKDTKVEIYDMDIMGAKGLQLKPGVLKMYASPGDTLIGDIQISLTEQLTKQFVPIKDGTERLINVLDSTLKSITLLTEKASRLIDANHESITSASGNIDTLSQTFNAQRKHFEDIVNNMKSFSEELVDSELKDVNSGNGSLGKFIKDGDFYMEMNESMTQLELLLKDMRENPKRYVHFSLFGRKSSSSDTIK